VWVGEVGIREPGKAREEGEGVFVAPGVNIGEGKFTKARSCIGYEG
jgi:hypothetical protein